jgi:hypothetical protein
VRLWSLHPQYLDPQGLVALWREALLARAVLQGKTKGYRHHPQLDRFKAHPAPRRAISTYLRAVYLEASRRGYSFDVSKIGSGRTRIPIPVTNGQIDYEWEHLRSKLAVRNRGWYRQWRSVHLPRCHPLMRARLGQVESWERSRD